MDNRYSFELRSPTSWPASATCTTTDELIDRLRELLDCQAGAQTFAVVFEAPVASDVKERINAILAARIRAEQDQYDDTVGWIDDLVDETGWQGVRATVDPALAPSFSIRPDEADADVRHNAFWADDRTFIHLELDQLLFSWGGALATSWTCRWVGIDHWHPGSLASGSWSDELIAIDLGDGPVALLEVQHMDEDGNYWAIAPCPGDTGAAARTVAGFLSGRSLYGFEEQLLPLIAHGLPVDGAAGAFVVDLVVEDNWNEGYEISGLAVTPPDDVLAELRRIGTLDADTARLLRQRIATGATDRLRLDSLNDLGPAWGRVIALLDEVSR